MASNERRESGRISVRVLSSREDRIEFEINNIDVAIANSLRRIMIAEIPTLCIDQVLFEDNSTSMQDEYIAHRLGLIPIRPHPTFNLDRLKYPHECTTCTGEEDCPDCKVIMYLDCSYEEMKEAAQSNQDADADNIYMFITSQHLMSETDEHGLPKAEAVHFSNAEESSSSSMYEKGINIMKIAEGQRLKFKATCIKGIAKEHAKWSPVCTVAMKHDPIVKIDPDALNNYTSAARRELVEVCPQKVFSYVEDEDGDRVEIKNESACIFCRECIYYLEEVRVNDEDRLGVTVQHSQSRFFFTVETTGAMRAEEVVREALKKLQEKVGHFKGLAQQSGGM